MEWRGVAVTNVYIGNFFFAAGLRPQETGRMRFCLFFHRDWHGHFSSMGARPR